MSDARRAGLGEDSTRLNGLVMNALERDRLRVDNLGTQNSLQETTSPKFLDIIVLNKDSITTLGLYSSYKNNLLVECSSKFANLSEGIRAKVKIITDEETLRNTWYIFKYIAAQLSSSSNYSGTE